MHTAALTVTLFSLSLFLPTLSLPTSSLQPSTTPVPATTPLSLPQCLPFTSPSTCWTTLPTTPGSSPLSDTTFRPVWKDTDIPYTYTSSTPDGSYALKAHFAQNALTLNTDYPGGFSFYAPGPERVNLTEAREASLTYSVYFQKGWAWNKGGKLPGFFGGDDDTIAMTCSGGNHDSRCFSMRLMWRASGSGEVYAYLPSSPSNTALCSLKGSICDPKYGTSLGRGNFSFVAGQWNTVTERVKLNDVGRANGEIELSVAGKSVVKVVGIVIATSKQGRIRGIQMQTFFGGSDYSWASPIDQDSYFKDFTVNIISKY